MLKTYSLLVVTIYLLIGCEKDQNDGIPSYVSVNNVYLIDFNGDTIANHGIADIWAQASGDNLGAIPLPATFALLQSGQTKIYFEAGFLDGTDFFSRTTNPFVKNYSIDTFLIEKDTIFIKPTFAYDVNTAAVINESFSIQNIFNGGNLVNSDLDGNALQIDLSSENKITISLKNIYDIPAGRAVFVEFHYKTNNCFGVPVFQIYSNGQIMFESIFSSILTPTNDIWSKVYFDISSVVYDYNTSEYGFLVEITKENSDNDASMFIDNFRVIHL